MMGAEDSSETLIYVYKSARRNITMDRNNKIKITELFSYALDLELSLFFKDCTASLWRRLLTLGITMAF